MKAKELITIIEEYNIDWSRQAILNEIEYIQRMMYEHPTMLSRAYSTEADGVKDPQFTVDANNEVVISDAFRIEKVYKTDPTCLLDVKLQGNTVRFVDNFAYVADPLSETKVRVRYYKKSVLTGEQNDLLIPDQYIDVLEAGVVERLAYKEHRDRQPFMLWKDRELPKFWGKVNRDFRFNEDILLESTNPYGV